MLPTERERQRLNHDLHLAALAYARRGWPVLPLKPRLKLPATKHGLNDATVNPDQINAWWKTEPTFNIGLRTGIKFDVLDLDTPEALDELDKAGEATGAGPILGPCALTGRGVHIYLQPTGRGNAAGILRGIDWRGVGGYVVAPPSVHPNGRLYEWGIAYPITTALQPAPQWLLDLWDAKTAPAAPAARARPPATTPEAWLKQGDDRAYGARALEGELGRLAASTEGTRNETLVRAAFRIGQLIGGGLVDPADAADQLLTVALRVGLGQIEAERTILSGLAAGQREPRQRPA